MVKSKKSVKNKLVWLSDRKGKFLFGWPDRDFIRRICHLQFVQNKCLKLVLCFPYQSHWNNRPQE